MKKILFALLALVFITSSCEDEKILVPTVLYVGETNTFTLSANGEKREIEITTTANLELKTPETVSWCKTELSGNKLVVTVDLNARLTDRSTTVTLAAPDRKLDITLRQSGQPSLAMTVVRAEASSAAGGYDIGVSYDGDLGNGFFVTNSTDAVHQLTYYLDPTDKIQMVGVTYYPRLPNMNAVVASGNFTTGSVMVSKISSPTDFQKVMDFDLEKTIKTTFLEFPAPQTNVYAIKFVIDGGAATQAGSASVREFVFNGTASGSASEKFAVAATSSLVYSETGGSTSIGVISNSTSISASSDAAWCTAEAESGFVKLTVAANTGDRRIANITLTGSDGGSGSIVVRQLAPSSLLEVTGATAVNVRGEVNVGEGAIADMYDGSYANGKFWHSDYGNSQSLSNGGPYRVDFALANVGKLSHIRYYPRQGATPTVDVDGVNQGGNGNIGRIEVWTKSSGDYTKAMDFACGEKGGMSEIVLPTPIDNVTGVRFVIISGRVGHASCSQMLFFGAKR